MSNIRPIMVIGLMLLWTALLLPIQALAFRAGWRLSEVIPRLYHAGLCRLVRLQVEVRGERSRVRPTLFVSNHVSWIDILVLAKLLPASFIAKREVAGWPLFGQLAKLHGAIFIERKARRTKDHRDEMTLRLQQGHSLILFPEGTSSDGIHLLPFKSAFFSLAEHEIDNKPLVVQPVSLTFAKVNHLPVGRRTMSLYAWVGDQELLPHLWRFLTVGPSTVVVEFHPPVSIGDFASRKDLCRHCGDVIRLAVSDVLSGRRRAPPAPGGHLDSGGEVASVAEQPEVP